MGRPEGFVFSQSSLQDYVDCPRRFELRYLLRCVWPAPETADALDLEQAMRRGHAFHRLLRQLQSGLPVETLTTAASGDYHLSRWWGNFLASPPQDLPSVLREAELTLSASMRGYRLEARYDLLAGEPGERWVIVDWKTGQHRAPRPWLSARLQTRIYPFLLVRAGATLNRGVPPAAEQVEMLYWFAEFPLQPERFGYSAAQYAADAAYLGALVQQIEGHVGKDHAGGRPRLPTTEDRRLCRFCVYRSLCWDDVQAGRLADWEDAEPVVAALEDLDVDSIAPVPF